MEGAKQYHKMITEFKLNVQDLLRRSGCTSEIWRPAEVTLQAAFDNTRINVHAALCDNIDTRTALDHIRDVVTEANKYLNNNAKVNSQLLVNICNYIEKMMSVFGVRFGDQASSGGQGSEKLIEVAEVLGNVREQLRQHSRNQNLDVKGLQIQLLTLCDSIRDELLPPLGIRLEDRDDGATSIKLVDANELMQEIKTKKEQELAKKQEKEKKKVAQAAKQANQEPLQDPINMFRTEEYSQWDANGIPTHDKESKEITKSQTKKLTKLMEAQKKKYEKWLGQQS
ncbi:hypothetical protein SK128_001748 [Halocaridina rubra]|uniref:Cysteine--tRNA ligase, cytoplasmic n=1 Tax=Halocaridina rubra TaxID=373956 RepID=A0AAN8WXA9_HALRR